LRASGRRLSPKRLALYFRRALQGSTPQPGTKLLLTIWTPLGVVCSLPEELRVDWPVEAAQDEVQPLRVSVCQARKFPEEGRVVR
jgi:hypothetical protein